MDVIIKIEPYISSIDFDELENGEIICCLGNWSVNIEHNYRGKSILLVSSPKFKLREILNNPDLSLDRIILDNNADQFFRYLKIQETKKFSNLIESFEIFKKEVLQRINEDDIKLFINCYKEFLISLQHFKEGNSYTIDKYGEMEINTYNSNDRIYYTYRFPNLHYEKKTTKFTFSGVYETEEISFMKTSPLLSLDNETKFDTIEKK